MEILILRIRLTAHNIRDIAIEERNKDTRGDGDDFRLRKLDAFLTC